MEQTLLQFIAAHPKLIDGLSVWLALSVLVNLLLLLKGPQSWVDSAKKNPTAALIINILFRAVGVDLVSVITHFRDYVNAKAAAKSALDSSAAPAAQGTEEKKS